MEKFRTYATNDEKKPNLLNHIKPLLTTHEVSDDQIVVWVPRLVNVSPQDVDLSLMVLARLNAMGIMSSLSRTISRWQRRKSINANEVCPPSTFSNGFRPKKGKHASGRLGRRIRAAEMQYAISRQANTTYKQKC